MSVIGLLLIASLILIRRTWHDVNRYKKNKTEIATVKEVLAGNEDAYYIMDVFSNALIFGNIFDSGKRFNTTQFLTLDNNYMNLLNGHQDRLFNVFGTNDLPVILDIIRSEPGKYHFISTMDRMDFFTRYATIVHQVTFELCPVEQKPLAQSYSLIDDQLYYIFTLCAQ